MDGQVIDKVLEAIRQPTKLEFDSEHQVAIVPTGMKLEDLSRFLPPPPRIEQKVTLLTVPAFVEYVNRFKRPDSSIFANETTGRYEAVLDYHHSAEASDFPRGDCDHTAGYLCPQSEQWLAWVGQNGKWFEQVAFAEFLETTLRDITEPPGATFLEIALQLQIHKSAEFNSEVNLDNGQTRFRYEETLRSGNKKAGDIDIPSAFTIDIPVFVDGAVFKVQARFRYRLDEGKLKLGYQLIRHSEVYQSAVKRVTAEVRQGAVDVHLYAGLRG